MTKKKDKVNPLYWLAIFGLGGFVLYELGKPQKEQNMTFIIGSFLIEIVLLFMVQSKMPKRSEQDIPNKDGLEPRVIDKFDKKKKK